MVSPAFLDLAQEINQTGRAVLEFGLQTIHKNEQYYIQRPNNMTKIKATLQDIQERKIETEVSLVFGLPGQTINSFKESIDFCKNYNVPTIYAFPLMLLRGTLCMSKNNNWALLNQRMSILIRFLEYKVIFPTS